MCWHKWSKWSDVLDTDIHFYKAQARKCEKCLKVSTRRFSIEIFGFTAIPASKLNEAVAERGE